MVHWASSRLSWSWQWTFWLHKKRANSWLAERVSLPQEGLFPMELCLSEYVVSICSWLSPTCGLGSFLCSSHLLVEERGFIAVILLIIFPEEINSVPVALRMQQLDYCVQFAFPLCSRCFLSPSNLQYHREALRWLSSWQLDYWSDACGLCCVDFTREMCFFQKQ